MQVGDIVCVKSGGPDMTVTGLKDANAEVLWFVGTDVRRTTLPQATLKLITQAADEDAPA